MGLAFSAFIKGLKYRGYSEMTQSVSTALHTSVSASGWGIPQINFEELNIPI